MRQVWLRQRGFSTASDGLNGFVMTMILVHLIQQRKANSQMSSYQLLRATLEFLRTADFTAGIAMNGDKDAVAAAFSPVFPVVFLDPSGRLNLMGRVSKATMQDVQHEAALTLSFLNDKARDAFPLVFMTPLDYAAKFDEVAYVELPQLQGSSGIDEVEDRTSQRHQVGHRISPVNHV